MHARTSITLALGSILAAQGVEAGCGINFQLAFVDSAGQVVQYLPPGTFQDWNDTTLVTVPDAQFFRATAMFPSCPAWSAKLWKNGVLIQEWWQESVTWTTNEPGLYRWWVEGIGNMGAGPVTRYIRILEGSATALGAELIGHDFVLRSIVVTEDARNAYLDCLSDQATDLSVELLSIDGRLQHISLHRLIPGENRVPVELPSSANALAVFRLTTREGVMHTRKVVL